ncbi:MAG TPA: c-type cytochrome domain-containing protein, partial [Bryobacteraceae bacterium]|nr:c-type cytochrome domain-containing protein [Bryobacteraceae bacterium]
MSPLRIRAAFLVLWSALCRVDVSAQDLEFFEKRVRPLLASQCYSCHGPDKQFSSLRLDGRDRIL